MKHDQRNCYPANTKRRQNIFTISVYLLIWFLCVISVFGQASDQEKPELVKQTGHTSFVLSVAYSPDGKILASSGMDGTIRLRDATTGKVIRVIKEENTNYWSISFSPDSKTLISGSNKNLKCWDVLTGKEIRTIEKVTWISEAYYSSDGKWIVSGSSGAFDYAVRLWDAATGNEIKSFQGHKNGVSAVAFSPDNKIIASGSEDRTIKLWNLESGQEIKSLNGHTNAINTVAFSPDGKTLASGGNDDSIKIWNVDTGQLIKSFDGHTSFVNSIKFSPDGKTLVSGSGDNSIKLWNFETGKEIKSLNGHTSSIKTIAFSPDGKALASGGDDNSVKLWNLQTFNEIKLPTISNVNSLWGMFSSNGKLLVWARNDGIARFWDIESGRLFDKANYLTSGIAKVLAVVPDFVRNPEKSKMSPDGKFVFKTSRDFELNLFEAETNKLTATLIFFDDDDWVATTPEGLFDGTPNAWKQLIWRFDNNTFNYAPVEAFFKEFYRPGLLKDIFAGNKIDPPSQNLSKIDIRQPNVSISAIDGKTVDSKVSSDLTSIGKRTVRIRVEITDNTSEPRSGLAKDSSSDAQDVRLFRNSSLVKLWSGNAFELTEKDSCQQIPKTANSPRKAVCETDVRISAGKNELTVYGFNRENVKSSDNTAIVTGADSLKQDGTLYVLAIGVNKYANAKYNLNYAVKDVTEIGRTLQEQQAKIGNLKQYAKTEVVTLTDELATKENILNALKLFAGDKTALPKTASEKLKIELSKIKPTQPEDALLIYYAGHGVSRKQRFYLIPHNFTGEAARFEADSVSDLELNDSLEKVDAGKLLMVIDACQSGQALGGKNDGKAPMNSKGFAQLAYDKGMYILTAAQSQQAALEAVRIGDKNIENGLLTYTLLQAFSDDKADKDANKQLWETEWFDFAVEQVPLFQREAMKQRSLDLKNNVTGVKGRSDLAYIETEKSLPVEARNVQTPRVFYRRETDNRFLIIANQQNR